MILRTKVSGGLLKDAKEECKQDLRDQKRELMDKIMEVKNKQEKTEKSTKELQLKNLGRELVAVLWLISAAIINAIPESLQLLPYY